MVTLANGPEIDILGENRLFEIRHLEIRHAVASGLQLARECRKRMDVAGNGRADDPEVAHETAASSRCPRLTRRLRTTRRASLAFMYRFLSECARLRLVDSRYPASCGKSCTS